MALPQLKTATYLMNIPSTGKEVEFRPYTVKEEKVLMIAMESKDQRSIIRALKSVIKDCVESNIDMSKLTLFDFEFIFLNLRAKSVGEIVDVNMKCQCDEECKGVTPVQVHLEKIEVSEMPESNIIQLDDKIGITFNFPSLETVEKYQEADMEKVQNVFDMIVDCTESIYDDEEVYDCKNETRENINNFYESLSSTQFSKVTEFFAKMPTVEHTIKYKCIDCEKEQEVELKGLQSFFT
tara:strand:+ start:98 stop:811 length:714 start_codon:yes stop_codon:yes gene_type:complete